MDSTGSEMSSAVLLGASCTSTWQRTKEAPSPYGFGASFES